MFYKLQQRRQAKGKAKEKGFTLMEVIVVIAIVAILAVIAIPTITGYIDETKEAACVSHRGSMLRLFQMEKAHNPTLTLQEHIDNTDTEDSCPRGGEYTAIDEDKAINCSVCDDGEEGDTSTTIDILGNIQYDGISSWNSGGNYQVGDLVEGSDGLIYQCFRSDQDHQDPAGHYGFWAWKVAGTTDGSAVSMDDGKSRVYTPGVTVTKDGKQYIYTPKNVGNEGIQGFNNISADWTEITDENKGTIIKPDKDTVIFNSHNKYTTGDVVWHGGQEYKMIKELPAGWPNHTPNYAPWMSDYYEKV